MFFSSFVISFKIWVKKLDRISNYSFIEIDLALGVAEDVHICPDRPMSCLKDQNNWGVIYLKFLRLVYIQSFPEEIIKYLLNFDFRLE